MKKIPVSIGEYIDKITILEIKQNRITNPNQLSNIKKELLLLKTLNNNDDNNGSIIEFDLYDSLKTINEQLWDIEDKIRIKEKQQQFDSEFVELARSVYKLNDRRSEIKRQINLKYNSDLIEEKSYNENNLS